MPGNILTQEKIKEIVNNETQKLVLENHYWIKDDFIGKIGWMALGLKHLSLKGINVSNKAFMDCVARLSLLQNIDISHCWSIEPSGITVLS